MPSRLPPHKPDQSRAPSLRRVVMHAFAGTTSPSDSLPAPRVFSHPALCARSLPDTGCQVGSLLFRILLPKRAAASQPRRGPAGVLEPACVYCLRRDMIGSALSNTFRLILMTWLLRSLPLRPACLPSACSGLSTPRSGRLDLSLQLGSATGCSSASPDRTFTCKKDTSSSGRTMNLQYRASQLGRHFVKQGFATCVGAADRETRAAVDLR